MTARRKKPKVAKPAIARGWALKRSDGYLTGWWAGLNVYKTKHYAKSLVSAGDTIVRVEIHVVERKRKRT